MFRLRKEGSYLPATTAPLGPSAYKATISIKIMKKEEGRSQAPRKLGGRLSGFCMPMNHD